MSIRAMLREISERTGINIETLRGRYRRGVRGADLEARRLPPGRRKEVQIETPPARPRALPVRVPESLRASR